MSSFFHGFERPSLLAWALGVSVLAILLALGTWQLQRLGWKADLLEQIARQQSEPPSPLPSPLSPQEAADWVFRPVKVSGAVAAPRTLALGPRTLGGRVGVHLVTAVRQEGQVVFVNLGWAPPDATWEPPEGPLTLTGTAFLPETGGSFTPDNQPERDQWFTLAPGEMAKALGLEDPSPIWISADAGTLPNVRPGAFPVGGQGRIDLPNNHLNYALTWYSLALVFVIMFALRHRRGASTAHPAASDGQAGEP